MLTIAFQPIIKFMNFLHTIVAFILTASYHIGRGLLILLVYAFNIARDIFDALAIIGEELYYFICELNTTITTISSYIGTSANGGINCVLDAVAIFVKHITKFVLNTRVHSKLLATYIGCFIGDFLNLIKNALLLIGDCAWWLLTLVPRCLLYTIIYIGDLIVDIITSIRKSLVYSVQIVLEDVFRLTIGIVLLFLLWHNHKRLGLVLLRWLLKSKNYLTTRSQRIFRRSTDQNYITIHAFGMLRRSEALRGTTMPSSSDKILDSAQRCVVCKDRQKCVLLLPCKHLCLCEDCANYMLCSAQRQNCPLCRTLIDHSMSVYI